MRILIIAQPRTGSTVFANWLSKELNYKWINEPFNMYNPSKMVDFLNTDNVVAKLIFEKNKGEWFYSKSIQTIDDLLSLNWDFVFILTRDDISEQAISKAWADVNDIWAPTKYKINDDWLIKNDKLIQKRKKEFQKDKDVVKSIKGYQITYEQIYHTNTILTDLKNILNIENFNYVDYLSNENRYRKTADYTGEDLFDKYQKKPYISII